MRRRRFKLKKKVIKATKNSSVSGFTPNEVGVRTEVIKVTLRLRSLLFFAVLATTLSAGSAFAATIQIVDRGWFSDTGSHTAGSQNAFVGRWAGTTYRGFMVFDLSSVTETISSGTLELELESYWGPNASETFEVRDVTSDLTTLQNGYGSGSAAGLAIYADLADGALYATVTANSGDAGTVLSFNMSAQAAADMEAARTGSGLFGIGFSVTTATGNQGLRWGTDGEWDANGGSTTLTSQVVTTTPEPATAVMLGLSLSVLGWLSSRKSRLVVA